MLGLKLIHVCKRGPSLLFLLENDQLVISPVIGDIGDYPAYSSNS